MNLRTLAVLLLATVATFSGCVRPRTQVVLVIDADPAMRLRATSVRLEAWSYDDARGANVLELTAQIGREVDWPFQTVLTPLGNDARRRYEVSATALDRDGNRVVVARAISGYTPNETRVLRLFLDTRCESRTCAAADATCREGTCVDVEILPGSLPTLSTYQTDAGPADAYLPPGTDAFAPDAWTPMAPDAGMDAFVEPPDAFVPMGTDAYAPDAFMPSGRFTSITQLPTPDSRPETLINLGTSVAASDGNMIAVGAPGAGDYLYDVTRPLAAPRRLRDNSCGQSAVINSVGNIAAFGCPSITTALVWEGPMWMPTRVGLGLGFGYSVAMNAGGSVLAFGGTEDIIVGNASASSGNVVIGVNISTLALTDDGTLLVAGVQNTVMGSRDEVRTFTVTGTGIASAGPDVVDRGRVVALSGDGMTLVVGEILQHRASVFRRSVETDEWGVPMTTLVGPDLSGFGASVAVSRDGTRIAVGATASDSACSRVCFEGSDNCLLACAPGAGGGGAVYVYDGSGAIQYYIRPPASEAGAAFGYSIALNRAGTRLVIGEPSRTGGGAVYLVE